MTFCFLADPDFHGLPFVASKVPGGAAAAFYDESVHPLFKMGIPDATGEICQERVEWHGVFCQPPTFVLCENTPTAVWSTVHVADAEKIFFDIYRNQDEGTKCEWAERMTRNENYYALAKDLEDDHGVIYLNEDGDLDFSSRYLHHAVMLGMVSRSCPPTRRIRWFPTVEVAEETLLTLDRRMQQTEIQPMHIGVIEAILTECNWAVAWPPYNWKEIVEIALQLDRDDVIRKFKALQSNDHNYLTTLVDDLHGKGGDVISEFEALLESNGHDYLKALVHELYAKWQTD